MPDYNMSESFNLWDVTPEQKTAWLKRYKELPQSKKPRMTENYLEISYDKDGDFEE
jgi:predicted Zn-dependent protease